MYTTIQEKVISAYSTAFLLPEVISYNYKSGFSIACLALLTEDILEINLFNFIFKTFIEIKFAC